MNGYITKYEVMEELSKGIRKLLEDMYQSGFDTIHDSTLAELEKAAELTEQYGMAYLSELLGSIAGEISAGRHRVKEIHAMAEKKTLVAELYMKLNEYLHLCKQKAAYDRGMNYYTAVWEDEEEFEE